MKKLLIVFLLLATISFAQTGPHWLQLIGTPAADPRTYGAKADGVTDDAAAIQACIDANTMVLISKPYRVESTIQLRSGVTVVGTPDGEIITDTVAFNASGSAAVSTTLASGSAVGDTSFVVTSVASFSVGDDILVTATNSKPSPTTYDYQEKFRILDITGTTLTLDRPVGFTYVSGGTVYRLDLLRDVTIKDLRITSDGASNLITMHYVGHAKIEGCSVDGNSEAGFVFMTTCFDSVVNGCNTTDTRGNWLVEVVSYCSGIQVTNNRFNNHYTTADGAITFWGNVLNSVIANNTIQGSSGAAEYGISLHFGSRNNIVSNNNVVGFYYGIYNLFSSNNNSVISNSLTGNTVGAFFDTVSATTFSGNTLQSKTSGILASGSSRLNISDNIIQAGTTGVLMRSSSHDTLVNNKITANTGINLSGTSFNYPRIMNNSIYSVSSGITSYTGGTSAIITGNTIINSNPATGIGIRNSGIILARITDNYISGCHRGISVDYNAYGGYIQNNTIFDCASYAISLAASADSSDIQHMSNNRIASCGATILGGATTKPNEGSALPNLHLGFVVLNNPVDWSAARTVYGWKFISQSATNTAAWSAISIAEE